LIAVPIIIDIIEDSKKEALKRSAENYLKAVELAVAKENLTSEFNPSSCTITDGNVTCDSKTLNVTVDGELPESGTISLQDGKILRNSSTVLTYDEGTLTYNEIGKLEIKKELKPALKVVDDVVYYVPAGSNEAIVYGNRGDVDYSNPYVGYMSVPEISGNVVIQSTIEIDGKIYPVTSIGMAAFTDALHGSNITSITIPEGVTNIGMEAFSNCNSLSSVNTPSSITNIGPGAFEGTPWLTTQRSQAPNGFVIVGSVLIATQGVTGDVVIPDGVTNIGSYAFSSLHTIDSITIPSSVTSIDSSAFGGNMFIETINIYSKENSIAGAPWFAMNATVNWLG
ncbi:MAG: leucine-rich repeat domain-containing protein, partial [bacterium]|nr:leucine-rich repeat domain-containing protein [bacterium]